MSNALTLGIIHAFEKLAISKETAQRVLLMRGIKEGLGDILSPQGGAGTIDRVNEILKKFPRTIRRAGPEAARLIYGPSRPQINLLSFGAKDAWKPSAGILRNIFGLGKSASELADQVLCKVAERAKNITPATGSMTSPGKQPGGAVPIEEKPITKGDRAEAIWR